MAEPGIEPGTRVLLIRCSNHRVKPGRYSRSDSPNYYTPPSFNLFSPSKTHNPYCFRHWQDFYLMSSGGHGTKGNTNDRKKYIYCYNRPEIEPCTPALLVLGPLTTEPPKPTPTVRTTQLIHCRLPHFITLFKEIFISNYLQVNHGTCTQ